MVLLAIQQSVTVAVRVLRVRTQGYFKSIPQTILVGVNGVNGVTKLV